MAKKATILFVLIIYSLTTFGVSLNYFYCCGKLKDVSVKIQTPEIKDCPVQKGKNCCEHKTVTIKLSVDQKNSGFSPIFTYHSGNIGFTPPALYSFEEDIHKEIFQPDLYQQSPISPPAQRSILFSVFRI